MVEILHIDYFIHLNISYPHISYVYCLDMRIRNAQASANSRLCSGGGGEHISGVIELDAFLCVLGYFLGEFGFLGESTWREQSWN